MSRIAKLFSQYPYEGYFYFILLKIEEKKGYKNEKNN